jgi:hypothetical protein
MFVDVLVLFLTMGWLKELTIAQLGQSVSRVIIVNVNISGLITLSGLDFAALTLTRQFVFLVTPNPKNIGSLAASILKRIVLPFLTVICVR